MATNTSFRLLTVKEAAEMLGLSIGHVYKLIHSTGTNFPVIKIGGEYRFNEEALIGWIMSKQEVR